MNNNKSNKGEGLVSCFIAVNKSDVSDMREILANTNGVELNGQGVMNLTETMKGVAFYITHRARAQLEKHGYTVSLNGSAPSPSRR